MIFTTSRVNKHFETSLTLSVFIFLMEKVFIFLTVQHIPWTGLCYNFSKPDISQVIPQACGSNSFIKYLVVGAQVHLIQAEEAKGQFWFLNIPRSISSCKAIVSGLVHSWCYHLVASLVLVLNCGSYTSSKILYF